MAGLDFPLLTLLPFSTPCVRRNHPSLRDVQLHRQRGDIQQATAQKDKGAKARAAEPTQLAAQHSVQKQPGAGAQWIQVSKLLPSVSNRSR